MNIKKLVEQARALCGETPPTVLKANESTGESPMELFMTDVHTEYYLSLKTSDETNIGTVTYVFSLIGIILNLSLLFIIAISEERSGLIPLLLIGNLPLIVSFIWESRHPPPLPIIFNRRTREIYFDHDGKLFHTPWDDIQAIAYEFKIVGPYVSGMRNAALEILIRRLGEPENALMLRLGFPAGKHLSMQKGLWEYLRAYMDNGPWFDENGNRSESDAFIKEQLIFNTRKLESLAIRRKLLSEENIASGVRPWRNYISGKAMLIFDCIFHSPDLIQDLVYYTAKRHTRNRWHEIVLERLRPDGPTTRLIDLERERGIKV